MEKIKKRTITLMTVLMLFVISLSIGGVASQDDCTGVEIVLVELDGIHELELLNSLNVEIIEYYDNHVLIEADGTVIEILESYGVYVDTLPKRTTIYAGGLEFDFTIGEPDIPASLRVDDYDPGVKGQYIVHMVGPIARGWRPTLEGKGVQVLNYMHNHAYRVQMTPELTSEVSELYFVDWVGIYHPYYKLQPGLETGTITAGLVSGASTSNIEKVLNTVTLRSFTELKGGGGYLVNAVASSKASLNELARIEDVDYIQKYVAPELYDEVATQIIGGGCWFFDDEYPHSGGPHRMGNPDIPYGLHGPFGSYMNQIDYTGDQVTIAVADSGLGDGYVYNAGHPDFGTTFFGRAIGGNWWDNHPIEGPGHSFSEGWSDMVYICTYDGFKYTSGHGTHVAGSAAGHTYAGTQDTIPNMDYYIAQGSAPAAKLYAQRIFDWYGIAEDPNGPTFPWPLYAVYVGPQNIYEIVEEAATNSTASIHTNSWGSNVGGSYDGDASSYDKATRDFNMVITVAAGNEGPDDTSIGSPGTSKNVITVGSSQNYRVNTNPENISSFSSRGWAEDNRVKPDVVAPGEKVYSTVMIGGWELTPDYSQMSGTSMATPAVAGAAAVTMQWYRVNHGGTPSPAMVKALLINTANDLCTENGNTGHIPNRDEGWGIVDISKLHRPFEDPVPFYLYDQEHVFDESGQVQEHLIIPDREGVPLKISLVWTDKEAGNVGSDPSLMNDLNFVVIAPCGAVYRGNAFNMTGEDVSDTGFSFPDVDTMGVFDRNEDGWDDTNNVENVYIPAEDVVIGNYTVRIRAKSITEDSVGLGYNSQDYALVVYNAELGYVFPTVFNMRGHEHTVNQLEAFKLTNPSSYELNLESSSIQYSTDFVMGEEYTVEWGIRVFIRDVNGDETERVDPGYAAVSRNSIGEGYQNEFWSPPYIGDGHIEVEEDDAIVIRVFARIIGPSGVVVPWTEQASFITDSLEGHLNGDTHIYKPYWNITYYTRYEHGISIGFPPPGQRHIKGTFYWGNMDRNSCVEGVKFITPNGGWSSG